MTEQGRNEILADCLCLVAESLASAPSPQTGNDRFINNNDLDNYRYVLCDSLRRQAFNVRYPEPTT